MRGFPDAQGIYREKSRRWRVVDVKDLENSPDCASPLWGCGKSKQGIAGNRRELASAGTSIGAKAGFVANRDLVT